MTIGKNNQIFSEVSDQHRKQVIINPTGQVVASENLPLHMTASELVLFRRYLEGAVSYIEFGSGGSTHEVLAHPKVVSICSIESDRAWVKQLMAYPAIKKAVQDGRLRLLPVDIGPTKEWGAPIGLSSALKWPDYYWGVWSQLPREADLILVDGRFRVATALVAVLMCHPVRPTIMLHDFSGREEYQVLHRFLEEMESADSLFVFRPQEGLVMYEVMTTLHQYLFHPFDRRSPGAPDIQVMLGEIYNATQALLTRNDQALLEELHTFKERTRELQNMQADQENLIKQQTRTIQRQEHQLQLHKQEIQQQRQFIDQLTSSAPTIINSARGPQQP